MRRELIKGGLGNLSGGMRWGLIMRNGKNPLSGGMKETYQGEMRAVYQEGIGKSYQREKNERNLSGRMRKYNTKNIV